MRRPLARLLLGVLPVLLVPPPPATAQALPPVTIGIVIDGPWERNQEYLTMYRQEILDLTENEFDVRFPAGKTITADWTGAGIRAVFEQLLADPEVDIVITMGNISSFIAIGERDLPRPVIAPFAIDPVTFGAPQEGVGSGVRNLSYLAIPDHVGRDLRAFREIVPFDTVHVLANSALSEAVPEMEGVIPRRAAELGIETETVLVRQSADEVLSALPDTVEAVYMAPLLSLSEGEFARLVEGLNARKIPTFSLFGKIEVEQGVLAGLTPANFLYRVARRVALHVQSILLGEEAGTLSIGFADRERLVINMRTARRIGLYPPWAVLTEAELLDDERRDVKRRLDLFTAVREAVNANLDLAARDREVAAGAAGVGVARAPLLPQADVSLQGMVIDQDRTSVLFNQAERTLAAGGSLSQLIYSDRAWAGYTIEKRLQEGRVYGRESLRLDIALDASTAYLDVLRAKTFERIEKENLELSRANLELARVREAIGQAGPEEVYRWEAQIANNRRAVIRTNAARNLLEIEFNRILHRPLEESFATDDVDLQHPGLSAGHSRYQRYMNDPWSFRILRAVLVDMGLAASPELRQIDAAIAAQERAYSAAGRSFWLPTFGLQGDVSQTIEQDGEGSGPPPASEIPGITIPDDTDWNVAVVGTLPLLEGGGRFAERSRTSELVAQLETERAATEQRLEQRIRSAMHRVGASYASIQQARLAAAASRRNLDLVTDSYSQGLMSIIQLIDAQNQALVAEQTAATSVYDFLIDLMEVQRSVNQFDFFRSSEDREAWFDRLDAAFERQAVEMGEGR